MCATTLSMYINAAEDKCVTDLELNFFDGRNCAACLNLIVLKENGFSFEMTFMLDPSVTYFHCYAYC